MLSFDYAPSLLKALVDGELKKILLGRKSAEIRSIYEDSLKSFEYLGQEGLAMWAISAVDTALWDLLGRQLNAPVWLLLGLNTTKVPAYGSGGWISYRDEELADEVGRHIKRGYAGVKIKIGGPSLDGDVERVRAVRRAIGSDKKLMIDANQGLTLDRALRTARLLEDCAIDWLEEPFPKNDMEDYCRLAGATEIPLAAGEREFGIAGIRKLVERRAVNVIQPDLMRVGGVTGWRLAANLAEASRLKVSPHFYKEYDVHLAACVPGLIAIEAFDWLDPLVRHPLEIRDGCVIAPKRPGFGVEFRAEAIKEYEVKGQCHC
jgi:L-alanine-DL-glutamate epimerase-like enolase superfamily enzyme